MVAAAALLVGLTGVMTVLVCLARRLRRRGAAGQAIAAAMAAFDQGWRPTAYEAHVEMRARDERAVEVARGEHEPRATRVWPNGA